MKLSSAQKEMLGWIENGHWLMVGDRNRVYTGSGGNYVGMRNTLLSLERLGLVERRRGSFDTWRKPPKEETEAAQRTE